MRLHKDGYIEARKIEFEVSYEIWHSILQFGRTRLEGMQREAAALIGIQIDDAQMVSTRVDPERQVLILTVEANWAPPSRR